MPDPQPTAPQWKLQMQAILFFFGLFLFLGPNPRHTEVLRPGVQSEL